MKVQGVRDTSMALTDKVFGERGVAIEGNQAQSLRDKL